MRIRPIINLIVFLIISITLINVSFAENWHQWRGANNDGISQETEVPTPMESYR